MKTITLNDNSTIEVTNVVYTDYANTSFVQFNHNGKPHKRRMYDTLTTSYFNFKNQRIVVPSTMC